MSSLESYVVHGHSMSPTFSPGDRLLVSPTTARATYITRGDLLIFRDGPVDERRYLKRIIGLPGEGVRQCDGALLINGRPLAEDYLGGLPAVIGLDDITWNLGAGECFMLGDNRAHSDDSRQFGPVGLYRIEGVVRGRYWPIQKLGRVKAPSYIDFTESFMLSTES